MGVRWGVSRLLAVALVVVVVCACAGRAQESAYASQVESVLQEKESFKVDDYVAMRLYLDGVDNATLAEVHVAGKYFPKVDQFARLTLTGSYNLTGLGADTRVYLQLRWAGYSDGNSTIAPLLNTTSVRISNGDNLLTVFRTATVRMFRGLPYELQWSDDCSECGDARCVDNACAEKDDNNFTTACEKHDCDFKVFVAWDGDDSTERDLSSTNKLPQHLNKYSLRPIYRSVGGFSDDFLH